MRIGMIDLADADSIGTDYVHVRVNVVAHACSPWFQKRQRMARGSAAPGLALLVA
jgi:hypothetical protein